MEALWMGYPWLKTACQSSMLSKNGSLVNFTVGEGVLNNTQV